MPTPYAFYEGRIVPLAEANINVHSQAFSYGLSVFEGIRGNWNPEHRQLYLFRIQDHFERFQRSCKIMKIDLPYTVDEYVGFTRQVLEHGDFEEDVYVRPVGYKTSEIMGTRLYDIDDKFLVYVIPYGDWIPSEGGITCITSSWRRADDTMIPARAKIGGLYVNSALAKTEAHEAGAAEAIMLNATGTVSEGSGSNLFIVKNGVLHTTGAVDNILEGITKETVSVLAKQELGIETVVRSIARSELYTADECFLTGTAAHIIPVREIDHRTVGAGGIGPITARLQALYFDVIRGRAPQYKHWLTPAYTKVRA